MPFYRYSATDKTGAQSMGTIEASSPDDAMLQLVRNGLNVSQLMKAPDQTRPQATTGAQQARPQEPAKMQPKTSQNIIKPTPIPIPKPTTQTTQTTNKPALGPIVHTKPASDRDRFLMFSQLAKQMKAGIGPAEALHDLRMRVPRHMSESAEEASKAATNGQPISDTFERYPDLYPENVVGLTRAAENGGFLEEAFELVSDQSQNAHQFGRAFWWIKPMILNFIIALPLAVLFFQATLGAWKIVDAQGEAATTSSSIAALVGSVFRELLWPVGPITLVLWGAVFYLYRYARTPELKLRRHELALRWPVIGVRTRHECLAVFSWVMSKLAKSGISPKKSWELAAASVPNLAVKAKLDRIGEAMSGAEKLSDAVFKEHFFPQEYAPIIATAEHTGDMPGAFEQLAKISQSEFEDAQSEARQKSGGWGRAGCIVMVGVIVILLFWFIYRELYPSILSGLDQ